MSQLKRRPGTFLIAFVLLSGLGVWGSGMLQEPTNLLAQDRNTSVAVDHANALSHAFRTAAEQATPSVVTVRSKTLAQPARRSANNNERGNNDRLNDRFGGENPFKGTPFEDFFRRMPEGGFNFDGQMPRREGVGSGVIIERSGLVLTNNHVVEGADEVTVRLSDGREFKATDIKTDPETDLAVLRIKTDGDLPAARLGNSDGLEIGDWVIAIGNPFDLEATVSAGIISGKGRELGAVRRSKFLQTDAAINPGNSGGPLVNLSGEVIGINTAIASNSGGYQGVGFAIPINSAKWITTQLVEKGSVERAFLGIGIQEVTTELAKQFGVKRGDGVLVSQIHADSPAASAGFQEGDVIVKFAGQKVGNPRELQEIVERSAIGKQQPVEILRDGQHRTLNVVTKALPADLTRSTRMPSGMSTPTESANHHDETLGIEVSDLTTEEAQKLGYNQQKGVVVKSVDDNGAAASTGLRSGMLIQKIGKTRVENLEQFREAIKAESLKDGVLMQVRTPEGSRFVVIQEG